MSTTDEEPCIRPGKRLKRCVESESEEEEEVLGVVSDKVSPPVTPPPMEPTPDRGAVLLHEKFDLTHNTILAIVKHLGGPKPDDRAEVSSNLLRGRFRGAQSYSFPYPGWDPRLKHYQLAGVHWMLTLHSLGVNGILADEMGLGKTAQSCAFLALLFEKKLVQHPAIVCCPATLIDNWLKELETWGKGLRVLKWHGPKETKFRAIEVFESGTDVDVVLTSFQTLSASWDRNMFFKGKQFSYLVVDEAHLLKNADSQMYRNLNQGVRFQNRLLLTGSPVQNSVSELRNLLLFLMSDRMTPADLDLLLKYFSKHDTIAHPLTGLGSEVISPVDSPSVALQGSLTTMARTRKRCRPAVPEVECLQLLVSPYILRRLKSDVLFDLPAKHLRVERCEMVGRQLQLYREAIMSVSGDLTQSIAQMMPKVRRKPDENEAAVPKTFVRSLCHRLRRICNHSLLYRGYFTVDQYRRLVDHYHQHVTGFADKPREKVEEFLKGWSDFEIHIEAKEHGLDEFIIPLDGLLSGAKIQSLLPIVDEITGQGRKALIFSQFTTFLDLIEEVLLLHRPDVGFFRLDGNTEIGLRQDMVDTFDVNKHISLFLLSTRAGGVGLNLTAADTVILMDQDYNPHNDRQAEDRVHRLGQTSEVTVIRLCCKGTLEESILRVRYEGSI
ncbi:MAG: uncharacterized protein KVP18_001432 [Porospora cf. gigantea A]|uniref:uncharacterized protein n=1 Tax=Porospora cf. gigantea A TaxID=2853593 RepID=UPI00355A6233|nr:MAG: hypothetical protein KVP18_001432 [Porospora cf. gigantea A]